MVDLDGKEGDLAVWWVPQVPMKSFCVSVETPQEAHKLLDVLGRYDAFQFENGVKPDYCNAGGLMVFEDGDWCDWYDPETGDELDDFIAAQKEEQKDGV